MDSNLLTLSKIFTERLFRIPDYQRGYAWTERQWKDFWNDIEQIGENGNHYTGVLTLERVPEEHASTWAEDRWIIESRGYEAYYVVDGQQRLTTAIILIQAIIESVPDELNLNYTTQQEIQKKFVYDSKDGGISRSYIFGYDKDNPSYEFLKTKIFKEHSHSNRYEETIYTNNLDNAKSFFSLKLKSLVPSEIENLYKKVTQSLLFNLFAISNEVDVCVAFETMNNRGRPLSYLELLKNRLIYLSLKIEEDQSEKRKLRTAVNDCWKSIYHGLGRNKDRPLDDDLFLGSHYILYYLPLKQKSAADGASEEYVFEQVNGPGRRRDHYDRLLQEIFIQKRVSESNDGRPVLSLKEIYEYVTSLQISVDYWYQIFNPSSIRGTGQAFEWLDKLDRIGGRGHLTLMLSVLATVKDDTLRMSVFKALERHIFASRLLNYSFFVHYGTSENFLHDAVLLYRKKIDARAVVQKINEVTSRMLESPRYLIEVRQKFKSNGFYSWPLIKYFLYEYNLEMQLKSKTQRAKIDWQAFIEDDDDHASVEHILPQRPKDQYWKIRFGGFNSKQNTLLRNSLGNLLPLSRPKNSSLSNRSFDEKVDGRGDNPVGYRYGCYAENEVTKEAEWTAEAILRRGLKMLTFLERRWNIKLGSHEEKLAMLGIDFVKGDDIPDTPVAELKLSS